MLGREGKFRRPAVRGGKAYRLEQRYGRHWQYTASMRAKVNSEVTRVNSALQAAGHRPLPPGYMLPVAGGT